MNILSCQFYDAYYHCILCVHIEVSEGTVVQIVVLCTWCLTDFGLLVSRHVCRQWHGRRSMGSWRPWISSY